MTVSYVLSGLLAAIMEGIICYVVDYHLGVRAYRWWYDLTHRDPLPDTERRGFIYRRRANARFTTATVVSLVQNGLGLWAGFLNPFLAMLTIVVEVPMLMTGFYLGPFVHRLWQRKDPLLDVVDKLESGETTVGAEMKRVTERVTESFREPQRSPESAVPDAVPPEVVRPADEMDPVLLLKRYTKRQEGVIDERKRGGR